jgi:hypothetical protein
LKRGPVQARVDGVQESEAADRQQEIPAGFEVL